MNQQPSFEDHVSLKIHHQQPPWNKIEMSKEPETHKLNKEFKEKYLSSCFDEVYNLTPNEIREWWELRIDLYFLYDSQVENHVKRLTSVWYLLTDKECESLKHDKWIQFGFQQADPTSDLRGGGVQALDDMINFIAQYKDYVLKEMCNPNNDFYFAASSINVTFFLKRYFHLHEKLDIRHKNVWNCKQSRVQKLLQIISQRRQFLVKTSQNASYGFILNLDSTESLETRNNNFGFRISIRQNEKQSQRYIFSLNLYKLRLIELILQIIKMIARNCTKESHQGCPITFINCSKQAENQRFSCGLCLYEAQNKDDFMPIEIFTNQVKNFAQSYNKLQQESQTRLVKEQHKQLLSKIMNLPQMIEEWYNRNIKNFEIQSKQVGLKINQLCQKSIQQMDQDDINTFIQLTNEDEQFKELQKQTIQQMKNKIEYIQNQIDNLQKDLTIQSHDIIIRKEEQLSHYLKCQIQNLLYLKFNETELNKKQQQNQDIIQINDEIYFQNLQNNSQIISNGFAKLYNQIENVLYIGKWKDSKFDEGIKIKLSTKELYSGKFKEVAEYSYLLDGQGYWTNDQEYTYEGNFIMDKFEEFGTKTEKRNNIKMEGYWINGSLSQGFIDTSEYKYIGGFTEDGKFQGQGTYTDKLNKIERKGNYKDNLLEGNGTESKFVIHEVQEPQNLTLSIFTKLKKFDSQKNENIVSQIEEGQYCKGKKIDKHQLYQIDEKNNRKLIKTTYYDIDGNKIYEE